MPNTGQAIFKNQEVGPITRIWRVYLGARSTTFDPGLCLRERPLAQWQVVAYDNFAKRNLLPWREYEGSNRG